MGEDSEMLNGIIVDANTVREKNYIQALRPVKPQAQITFLRSSFENL